MYGLKMSAGKSLAKFLVDWLDLFGRRADFDRYIVKYVPPLSYLIFRRRNPCLTSLTVGFIRNASFEISSATNQS